MDRQRKKILLIYNISVRIKEQNMVWRIVVGLVAGVAGYIMKDEIVDVTSDYWDSFVIL